MSNETNSKLFELAREVSEEWVGTPIPDMIEALIKSNDLDELRAVLKDIETGEAFRGLDTGEVQYA